MTIQDIIQRVQDGKLKFRALTKTDWYAFAGCEQNAVIAEDDDFTYVLDGDQLEVVRHDDGPLGEDDETQFWTKRPATSPSARSLDQ